MLPSRSFSPPLSPSFTCDNCPEDVDHWDAKDGVHLEVLLVLLHQQLHQILNLPLGRGYCDEDGACVNIDEDDHGDSEDDDRQVLQLPHLDGLRNMSRTMITIEMTKITPFNHFRF